MQLATTPYRVDNQAVALWFAERAIHFHLNAAPTEIREAHLRLQENVLCANGTCPICYAFCGYCRSRYANPTCLCH
jgi:hypothetical protein